MKNNNLKVASTLSLHWMNTDVVIGHDSSLALDLPTGFGYTRVSKLVSHVGQCQIFFERVNTSFKLTTKISRLVWKL